MLTAYSWFAATANQLRAAFSGGRRSDLNVENKNTLKVPGVNNGSLIIWRTYPDIERILIPGVNRVIFASVGSLSNKVTFFAYLFF